MERQTTIPGARSGEICVPVVLATEAAICGLRLGAESAL